MSHVHDQRAEGRRGALARLKVEGRGERDHNALVLGAATLLLGDTFVPWHRTSRGTFSYSWNAWHGDKGIALGALTAPTSGCLFGK